MPVLDTNQTHGVLLAKNAQGLGRTGRIPKLGDQSGFPNNEGNRIFGVYSGVTLFWETTNGTLNSKPNYVGSTGSSMGQACGCFGR